MIATFLMPLLSLWTVLGMVSLPETTARTDILLERELNPTRSFRAIVTAYSSSPDETWGNPLVTASGRPVQEGVIACPRRFAFGTQFLIRSRVYTCWDRLHPAHDNRFDIWKPSKERALRFGRQRLIVQVL
jgi:3D (Asp-Asp-Asp) domain-containing protein